MTEVNEIYINNEVRIRLLEKIAENSDKKFDKLEAKIDSHFHWILGSIFTVFVTLISLFGGVILHLAKLI
jgi:hypothetical protein